MFSCSEVLSPPPSFFLFQDSQATQAQQLHYLKINQPINQYVKTTNQPDNKHTKQSNNPSTE